MRLYTLAEADGLLPEVVPVLETLRDAYVELRAIQASVASQSRGASGDGHLLANPWETGGEDRMKELDRQLQRAATRLDRWGIEVKDPERGLVDFFHQREGRVVYLCFLLGEPAIAFWHELNAGFAGRQRLA
ncbi:MAG TPA: DUF2203 domain-containing protein [Tepidiformaceae bacterium]|nr:DUF2203 domain-containing protein [Tepidiformaceae bacterium]HNO65456.1 DUF2203 domain-containing protein [Tepidiformaceae bacterium]